MNMIDVNIKPLFQSLEETGILLDEGKLLNLIRESQKRLAEQKQIINRETGFIVDLYSQDSMKRAIEVVRMDGSLFLEWLVEVRRISSLIRRMLQVYDLAHGNHRVLGREFGLYPKYGLDLDGNIITISELSIGDFPDEILGVVSYEDSILVKATYSEMIWPFSGDPGLAATTATDLAKLGFINLFEDYRLGRSGSRIFAVIPYSIYLFVPDVHADFILSVVRDCLENVHSDFTLPVDVTSGKLLDKLT